MLRLTMPWSLSSPDSLAPLDRIQAWLQDAPLEAIPLPAECSQKPPDGADIPRTSSPKRRRVDADDMLPTYSAS